MRFIRFLIILVFFLFCLLFFTQNKEALSLGLPLKIDLFVENISWQGKEVPYYFVALGCLAAGMLFSTFFFLVDRVRLTYTIIEKKHKISRYTNEITQLNTLLENERKEMEKVRLTSEHAKKNAEDDAVKKFESLRQDLENTIRKEVGLPPIEEKTSMFGRFLKAKDAPATADTATHESLPLPDSNSEHSEERRTSFFAKKKK